jgi:hypothetical protein
VGLRTGLDGVEKRKFSPLPTRTAYKTKIGVGNKWARMKTEAVVACLKALFPHSPGRTAENNENALIRITGVPAEIRTGYRPNTGQKRYRWSPLARYHRTNISNHHITSGSATV